MTERGPRTGSGGAPGPAGPSTSGGPPGAATLPTADLSAVRRSDAIIESLAAWRLTVPSATVPEAPSPAETSESPSPCGASAPAPLEPAGAAGAAAERSGSECGRGRQADERGRQADEPDPAVRLLRALIIDVDDQGSESEPAPPPPSGPGTGPRRRGPRTIVALGVAGAVLAGSGVAAAGGAAADHPAASSSQAPRVTGVADGAEKQAGGDIEAVAERRRPPVVRPLPERPATRKPAREYDPIRTRPRYPFPDRPRFRRPADDDRPPPLGTFPMRGSDDPYPGGNGWPGFADPNERPQKRFDQYRDPYSDPYSGRD
ncbi:hypothetical protein [Actinomadura decatromicini]|uniref:Uncharacterized protein n=1 Tax=Actinomadura decatromicini TaxID=2604572 RepID=A0A5D3FH78_9ACTN|nr:hypothetical protein [Actinomadura decatromicini]TYK47318.1 hypothetical protein FXF68_26405 [Actinomadura decatromicini]